MKDYNDKIFKIIGHSFFIILFFYAIIYSIERVLYLDSAAQLFEMINLESFKIYVNRSSMVIQQLLPVAAIKLRLSLKSIVILYSISFFVISYLIFIIIAYKIKDNKGVVLLLLSTIGVSHTFFHAISETYQLLIYSSFFFVTLNYKQNIYLYYIVNVLLIIIIYYIHPVSIFLILFALIFKLLNNFKDYRLYLLFIILGILIKINIPNASSHNAKFLNELQYAQEYFNHLFELSSTKYFISNFYIRYSIPTIILLFTSIFYLIKKKFLKFLFINSFIVVFLILSFIIYNKGDFEIGMERSFLPYYYFVLVPFVYDVLFNLKKPIFISCILLVSLLFNEFIQITLASDKYVSSIKNTNALLEEMDKIGVSKAQFFSEEIKPIFTNWSASIESLLLSSLKGKDSSKTFFLQENYDLTIKKNDNNSFYMTYFWKYTNTNEQRFNANYFNLPLEPYELIYNFNPIIIVNNETISNDEYIVKKNNDTIYYTTKQRDSTFAFSGKYSCKTDSINPYGLTYNFDTPYNIDSIKISIKRFGNKKGNLIFDSQDKYFVENKGDTVSDGWVLLRMTIVKENLNSDKMFKVYVWNSGKETIWFDDLIIKIYKKNSSD